MRDIKFRAWNADYNWMNDNFFIQSNGVAHDVAHVDHNDPNIEIEENPNLIIMQYTGLKDKNGVEIYEGDIVDVDEVLLEVKYLAPSFRFFGVADAYGSELANCRCKVIGNIHQNPELLEK